MKFLLIHPNQFAQRYISLGVSMIAAVAREHGHTVSFLDTSRYLQDENLLENKDALSRKNMAEALQFKPIDLPLIPIQKQTYIAAVHTEIENFHPDLIGISASSSEFKMLKEIATEIKQYGIPTIAGGIHPTIRPEETLQVQGIDMVLVGEGDEAIIELLDSLEQSDFRTNIANIYFKKDGKIIKNEIKPYIRDLDTLPFMALDIFDDYHHIGAYNGKAKRFGRFQASRGCPYECAYCVNSKLHEIYQHEKKHVRFKSPKRFVEELEQGLQEINFEIIRLIDETFTAASTKWLKEFARQYKEKINKPLIITTRPESATKEKLSIIRTLHSEIQITMGIETGAESFRKSVCKRSMSNKSIIKAFANCHALNFKTASFNMIGLPGETRNLFFETIRINREARVDTPILSYFYPFPGAPLRQLCISKGFIDNEIHEADYSTNSYLKMPQFSKKEMKGLKRTFSLYIKLDKKYYPEIRRAETDDEIFSKLSKQFWTNGSRKISPC